MLQIFQETSPKSSSVGFPGWSASCMNALSHCWMMEHRFFFLLLNSFYSCFLAVTPDNPHSSLVIQLTKSIDGDLLTQRHQNRQADMLLSKQDQITRQVLQDPSRLLERFQSSLLKVYTSCPIVQVSSVKQRRIVWADLSPLNWMGGAGSHWEPIRLHRLSWLWALRRRHRRLPDCRMQELEYCWHSWCQKSKEVRLVLGSETYLHRWALKYYKATES